MDKETAMYWQTIIEMAVQGDKKAATTIMEEDKRRRKYQLPTIEVAIEKALNPTIQNHERETGGLPERICEWP